MTELSGNPIECTFYFSDSVTNRKKLFEKAIEFSRVAKVLYVSRNEIEELPQLSQDLSSVDKHYMKMISFLYAHNLDSLIDSIATLDSWQNIPATIILDDLSKYCNKEEIQNACGVVALLIDIARSCSVILNTRCRLFISITQDMVGLEFCNLLNELYSTVL